MTNMIFLKPKDQAIGVIDPKTRAALPAGGALVARNAFWLRRLAEGDVVEVKAAQAVVETTAAKAAAPASAKPAKEK